MNVWEERDVTDEITSEPILSMGCGEIQPKTESPDPKMTPEEWQIPMKRVKSTCTKFRASNRKFVQDNKFEPIAEQSRDKKTKQGRSMARFDCDGGDAQVGNEGRSGDIEGRRKDPNLAGMLLSSSVESEPLCETGQRVDAPCQSRWWLTVVLPETIISRMWFPNHKTAESEGSQARLYLTRRQTAAMWKKKKSKR